MKHFLLFGLLVSTTIVAQERTQLKGVINDVLKEPLEGITVFNTNSLEGTVSNEDGKFFIDVRSGDKLSIDAVQFDSFSISVTQAMIDKGTTTLTFTTGVNLLEEVVVTDQRVRVAVKRTEMPDVGLDKVSQRNINVAAVDRIENTFSGRVRQPEDMPLINTAMGENSLRFNGVDLLGLLIELAVKAIFGKDDLIFGAPIAPEKRFQEVLLKNQYSTEYLTDYLKIPEENLYEFMVYAQEEGLNESMLTPENEFELLQFLGERATIYRSRLNASARSNFDAAPN